MHSVIGTDITATLPVTGPPPYRGARIEVPITRAIASMFQPAALDELGENWEVTLESPVAIGDYNIVWLDQAGVRPDVFVPLFVEAAV